MQDLNGIKKTGHQPIAMQIRPFGQNVFKTAVVSTNFITETKFSYSLLIC